MDVSDGGGTHSAQGCDDTDFGLTARQRDWLTHIRQCESERLSFQKYCEREGLNVKSLYAARRALVAKGALQSKDMRAGAPPRFAAVRLSQPEASVTLEALLPNRVQVRIGCDDVAQASALMTALSRL